MRRRCCPEILNELGVTTIPLNAGLREGAHHRTVPDETALISKTVRADIGCMISPTGERITLIDDIGVVMDLHESFGILASWWLRSSPGTVLAPAATPMWISDAREPGRRDVHARRRVIRRQCCVRRRMPGRSSRRTVTAASCGRRISARSMPCTRS